MPFYKGFTVIVFLNQIFYIIQIMGFVLAVLPKSQGPIQTSKDALLGQYEMRKLKFLSPAEGHFELTKIYGFSFPINPSCPP